jgi:hypothetical protein
MIVRIPAEIPTVIVGFAAGLAIHAMLQCVDAGHQKPRNLCDAADGLR